MNHSYAALGLASLFVAACGGDADEATGAPGALTPSSTISAAPDRAAVTRLHALEAASTWTPLVAEWQSFALAQQGTVRYGVDAVWLERSLPPGQHACTNAYFGLDPLPGAFKRCELAATAPAGSGAWIAAVGEWQSFVLAAARRVRYGAQASWVERDLPAGQVWCTNTFFGVDPLPGVVKRCELRGDAQTPPPPAPPPPAPGPGDETVITSVAAFELLGGWRLRADFASEGLALVRDAQGWVVEAISGAHAHQHAVHVFDLRQGWGAGSDANAYPVLPPLRTWSVESLFPRWIPGQNLRDVTAVTTPSGYELAGIGRVFYNTAPRPVTQINVRELRDGGATLGATREIPVNLPEQEVSGFIKHEDSRRDLGTIGAGAYDSGQGSVGGLSYAVRDASGSWARLLDPPSFGDVLSARLPRDALYSCAAATNWVCIPPANGVGVWSTERVAGGAIRIGRSVMFLPTLGYGERGYARQSYTFGDPALDRAVAYFFTHPPGGGAVRFERFEAWPHAAPGQPVIGLALGRIRGHDGPLLFVLKSMAWSESGTPVAPVLQVLALR